MAVYVGALGIGAVASIVNSLSTLTLNVYSLSSSIKLSKNIFHDDIKDVLVKTDLEANIKLLHSIIAEIPQYYILDNISIIIAFKNVQEIIVQIEEELNKINDQINYNNNLYVLKNARSYDFKPELRRLEAYVEVMEKRKINLFKTLELFKNCSKSDEPNKKLLNITHIDKSIYNEESATLL
jgi:hypothetical protein